MSKDLSEDRGDGVAYCNNGCGLPAVGERLFSVDTDAAGDLEEVVELICIKCVEEAAK